MICPIATPSAVSAYAATMNTDIPAFTAVNNPIATGLAMPTARLIGEITERDKRKLPSAQLE